MLLGVLSFIDLAGGVVAFTNAASIWCSCRPQNTVAAHPLQKTKKSHSQNPPLLSSLWDVHKHYLT